MAISHIADGAVVTGTVSVIPAVPTNIAGDLLYATITWYPGPSNVTTITPPAGWTQVDQGLSSAQAVCTTYRRISNGSEPGTYTWSFSPAAFSAGQISSYRGVDQTTPININGNNNGASTAPTAPSVTTTVTNTWLLTSFAIAANSSITLTGPGACNQRALQQPVGATTTGLYLGDQILAASGASGTVVGSLNSSDAWAAVNAALQPAVITIASASTPQPPQATRIIQNFGMQPLRLLGFWDFPPFQAAQPIGYPVTLPPPIAAIIQNFSPRVWPVGFWDSRVVSAANPVGPSPARAIPIAAILKNWSQWLSPIPTWTPSLFNPANPPAIPSPNAVPIAAILSNFSMPLLRVPAFGTGFNSSFPQAFPTPPAPNIPAIIGNFSARVFPQGFISAWSGAPFVPQGYPTAPAPNIPQILLNFGPRVLALPPRLAYETATVIVPSVGPSPSALPIAAIVQGWTPRRIFPPYSDSWNFSIPPPPIGYPTPPAPNVRQILLNFYPQPPNLIIPFYGSGIFVPIPTPVPGGLHSAFTLIIADSFRYLLLSAGSELTRPLILADDMLFFLESAAPALAVNLQLAATAHNITLVSVG